MLTSPANKMIRSPEIKDVVVDTSQGLNSSALLVLTVMARWREDPWVLDELRRRLATRQPNRGEPHS